MSERAELLSGTKVSFWQREDPWSVDYRDPTTPNARRSHRRRLGPTFANLRPYLESQSSTILPIEPGIWLWRIDMLFQPPSLPASSSTNRILGPSGGSNTLKHPRLGLDLGLVIQTVDLCLGRIPTSIVDLDLGRFKTKFITKSLSRIDARYCCWFCKVPIFPPSFSIRSVNRFPLGGRIRASGANLLDTDVCDYIQLVEGMQLAAAANPVDYLAF